MAREEPRTAAPFVPAEPTLENLSAAAAGCTGCDLYRTATQTVFGEGPPGARVMLVGEQPGDQEDRAGHPFVGPAGRMLDRALADAGIEREGVYVTNVVKHFKFKGSRGKKRLHARPGAGEVRACRPWLDAELSAVRPDVLVCLGATAAQALLGRDHRAQKGRLVPSALGPLLLATLHPSAVLRMPDREARHAAYEQLVADLRVVAEHLGSAAKEAARAQPGRR